MNFILNSENWAFAFASDERSAISLLHI
jgi:hypothetical protein